MMQDNVSVNRNVAGPPAANAFPEKRNSLLSTENLESLGEFVDDGSTGC